MRRMTYLSIFLLALLVATAPGAAGPLAKINRSDAAIQWTPMVQGGTLVLTISGPQGFYHRQRFDQGSAPSFSVFTKNGGTLPEGAYAWELVLEPSVSKADHEAMAAARGSDAGGLLTAIAVAPSKGTGYASGYFGVLGGAFVTQERESSSSLSSAAGASSSSLEGISSEVVLTNGDGVIRNSLCVGFDCPDAPAFGDSTILLMENNTRIKFGDTSNSPFPNNDWEIEANSSLSGGANYLGFNDCGTADNDGGCASDLVFAVESGARANALYVESDGDIGVGTSNPVVDLHIVTGNTPTVRLDQDGSSGFTPQVWDIAGNETNFFVRDVTSGSRLPFRIQPNAPTNSIFVTGTSGNVGLGTSSPSGRLHVRTSNADTMLLDVGTTSPTATTFQVFSPDGSTGRFFAQAANSNLVVLGATSLSNLSFRTNTTTDLLRLTSIGRAGFSNTNPGHPLVVGTDATNGNTAHVTVAGVWTDGSSRKNKTDIHNLDTNEALAALDEIQPVRYKGINDTTNEEYLGFIAEDVPGLVAMNGRQGLSPMDMAAMLTAVVKAQRQAIEELEAQLKAQRETIGGFEARLKSLESAPKAP